MVHKINDTSRYHREELDTLGWEATVCRYLESAGSPCRKLLTEDGTYGEHLVSFLEQQIGISRRIKTVLEAGGGDGFLMRDLLKSLPHLKPAMLDISPVLLACQETTLAPADVTYINDDLLTATPEFLSGFDLVIMNEILGDFPTLTGFSRDKLAASTAPVLKTARALIDTYGLAPLPHETAFNLGALQALEKLCRAEVPNIFLSEHSCEAVAPDDLRRFVEITADGVPARIRLKGHDEYTIKFSYLERIARSFGYAVNRGPIADFLPLRVDDRLRTILAVGSTEDEHEIIRHFVSDLFQYEYLLCRRKR